MKKDTLNFTFDSKIFTCHLACDRPGPRPAVLVFPPWWGLNSFSKEKAEDLARIGYVGIAIDPYGEGKSTDNSEEAMELMMPLFTDRPRLRDLLNTALQAVRSDARVDSSKIAAIGFCFGGMCVLELALSGASLSAVVSFHGVLGNPWRVPIKTAPLTTQAIPSILILHGYQDPLVPPEDLTHFETTLVHARADFEVNIYSQAGHAFTYPAQTDKESKVFYEPRICRLSEMRMRSFLEECFN